MSPDSSRLLPRSTRDPEYLLGLRQRAMARMRQDEEALAPSESRAPLVSRRWSLQRIALVAAGLTPAAVALLRTSSALASPSPRCNAPQYGAPGIYAAPTVVIPAPTFATRDELKSLATWTKSSIVVVPNSKATSLWGPNTRTLTASHELPSGEIVALDVASDAKLNTSYVVRANGVFYALDGADLLGFRFGTAELIVTPSLFKMPTPPDGDAGVVARFAEEVDDKKLAKAAAPSREIHIDLTKGVTPNFWTPDPQSGRTYPFIFTAGVIDGVLEFSCNLGGRSGTFQVDLKTKKLIKFTSFG